MKKSIKLLAALLTLSAMLFPAAAAKSPRTMKTSASKVKSLKTAKQLAENYQLKTTLDIESESPFILKNYELLDSSLKTSTSFMVFGKEYFIAQNEENGETVVFINTNPKQTTNLTKLFFVYTYLNNEASSYVLASFGDADMALRNAAPGCSLDASNAILENDERETKLLAGFRMTCKECLYKDCGIEFKDVINEKQIKTAGFDDSKVMDFLISIEKNKD